MTDSQRMFKCALTKRVGFAGVLDNTDCHLTLVSSSSIAFRQISIITNNIFGLHEPYQFVYYISPCWSVFVIVRSVHIVTIHYQIFIFKILHKMPNYTVIGQSGGLKFVYHWGLADIQNFGHACRGNRLKIWLILLCYKFWFFKNECWFMYTHFFI